MIMDMMVTTMTIKEDTTADIIGVIEIQHYIGNVERYFYAENGFYTPLYKDFAVGLFVKLEKKE